MYSVDRQCCPDGKPLVGFYLNIKGYRPLPHDGLDLRWSYCQLSEICLFDWKIMPSWVRLFCMTTMFTLKTKPSIRNNLRTKVIQVKEFIQNWVFETIKLFQSLKLVSYDSAVLLNVFVFTYSCVSNKWPCSPRKVISFFQQLTYQFLSFLSKNWIILQRQCSFLKIYQNLSFLAYHHINRYESLSKWSTSGKIQKNCWLGNDKFK